MTGPQRSFLAALAIALGTVVAFYCAADTADNRSMEVNDLVTKIRENLPAGMKKGDVERLLSMWGISFGYVPKDEFRLNTVTTTIIPPPTNSAGALVGSSRVLKKGNGFETFVVVVVYVDEHDQVLSSVSKVLTAGP